MEEKLRNKILDKIKPSLEEQEILEKIVKSFIRKLKKSAKKLNYDCEFFIGGSFGKNTYLKTTSDVDLFCRFNKNYDDENISNYLSEILLNAKFNFKKQKGSRDYFSLEVKSKGVKLIFEIIPNLLIENLDEAKNTTDISPFHIDFLKEKCEINKNLCDEIRLTKQFFKAHNLYGAESYINGFSGHSIDILIAHFKSLENLLISAKTWQEDVFIDVNNFYENKTQALEIIDSDKISNLILIDPIDKKRNAARALGNEKYCEFLIIANKFVNFKEEDFEIVLPNFKEIILNETNFAKENNLNILIYSSKFKIVNESEDIVGAKLLKISKKLKDYFLSFGFDIFKNNFLIDMKGGLCLMIYLFEKKDLANVKIAIGPKAYMSNAVDNFLKENSNWFIKDGRVCIYEKKPKYKLKEITKLTLYDFNKILTKDTSFIKSVKRIFK